MNITKETLSHRESEPEKKVLYVVATPIGNLNDISIRALNILKNVSCIACEDTRNTGKLLKHFQISNKLISFHQHNSFQKLEYLASKLKDGDSVALVTDAGMPLISDPGEILVKKIRELNLDVVCIPGPCAALTALVSSGISTSKFTFYGFLPKISKERSSILMMISKSRFSSIVYESPKRIIRLLEELSIYCGGKRNIALLKELTKKHEQNFGHNIDDVLKKLDKVELKGEYTLVIAGNNEPMLNDLISNESLKKDLIDLMKAGLSHSSAANFLSKKSNKTKSEIYRLIIKKDLG